MERIAPGTPGHKDVRTTIVYTDLLKRGGRGVHSPLDRQRKGLSFFGVVGLCRPIGRPKNVEEGL